MSTLALKNKRGLTIVETILLSVLFHAAFLLYIPSLNIKDTVLPMELNIDILISEPEPIKEIIPEPKPKPKLEPIQKIEPKELLPIKELAEPEPIAPIIKPEPIALPKKNNIKSNPFIIEKVIESYSSKLTKAIARQKKYPRIAQMRGWQGEIILDLEIDGKGNLIKSKIKQGSKFKILDKEGMNMVKRASPFPKPPKELESKIFNVIVPISFKLQ
ncbi:energy transducer TonB [Methylophilaceae bacterium]|nr:energy transducer TonB [Methylophilaceae bacterium]